MARILIPTNFLQRIALLKTLKTKIDADGTTGPLVAMLAQRGIDLVADTANGASAIVFDQEYKLLSKLSQKQKQTVNAASKIIIDDTTGAYQNLKTLFEPNYKSVGDWGAVITDSGKFNYPINFTEWMEWFTLLKAKNDSYVTPAVSPLLSYLTTTGISLTKDATNGAAALLNEAAQDITRKASERARLNRDNKFKPVVKDIRIIARFLLTLYSYNVKILGDYGITVVLTPKAIKTRIKLIKASTSVLNIRVELGSTVLNSGTIPIPIHKGATLTDTPNILAVGKTFTISRGFGKISFHNPLTDVTGQVTLIPANKSV